ncbi:MAG: flagellar assembly protein FliW [Candidatus Sericytochromatia bacterium]|nr:flagellar assembly protein FliW [Candidatus Sericytochromatia bacterium]
MLVETRRFGPLEVSSDAVIHFPLGLLGFERYSRYIIVDSDQTAPMRWLQCVEDPNVAVLVVEPTLFFPDYDPFIHPDDRGLLQLDEEETPVLACVVVIPDDPSQMTINLLGPLVMNAEKRLGKQVVLSDSSLSARHRLIPDASPSEAVVPV